MRRALLAAVASATLAGCVTIDATLAPDGSATFRMTYRTGRDATEFMEKRRVASEDVVVDRAKIEEDGLTTVDAHVGDVTRLSTSAAFRDVTVTRARHGAEEDLTIVIVNRAPVRRKDDRHPGPRVTITLPGEVVRANERAVVAGNRVTWAFWLSDYAARRSLALRVRYRVADADASRFPHPG